MFKKLILILLIFQLGGCEWFKHIGSPYYSWTTPAIPDGTPAFQQGFRDGCSTSTYARSNVLYRNKNSYKYDPAMIGNPEYRFGHSRGYTWCFQQALSGDTGAVGSWDKYLFPGGYDTTFNSGDIGGAWDGFFGGTGGSLGGAVGGDVGGFMGTLTNSGTGAIGTGGGGPLWAGGSSGQIFGQ
ncbi:MAG: hypothetical protein KGQ36_03085 [Rickettsiales bacterium]|nr:hypothetical protein [Rickettsiales bacterium]